jgi:hypothetical protein
MWIYISGHKYKFYYDPSFIINLNIILSDTIQYACIFHEYLPDDDPAGSKHIANVQINKY